MKFDFFLPEYFVDHALCLFHDVVVDGIMIKHLEIGGVDSHFYLVDKLSVVEIYRLHRLGVNLFCQEQVGFSDAFALEVAEEGLVACMFAEQIDENHAQQEKSCCDACVF